MDSIQLTIEASEADQEILISLLSDYNPDGFEQKENYLIACFSPAHYAQTEINQVLKAFHFEEQIIAEQNWNNEWEKNFQPVMIGNFCAIRAEFHPRQPGMQYDLVITPKMSFGTGHHATTFMMVDQMRSINFSGKSVLDFGTGTGILAILAEKMGARRIMAIDKDVWSIRNAAENIQKNNCRCIRLVETDKVGEEIFDIILANLNRNIILTYLPVIYDQLSSKGYLLLSGLLHRDAQEVVPLCQQMGLTLNTSQEKEDWISLLFVKEYCK
ncbi:MAG: 50S ribosomal protein L11 methyltransferase [Flavisolibacter sp.]